MTKGLILRVNRVFRWLHEVVSTTSRDKKLVTSVTDKILTVFKTRGIAEGIRYSKFLRSSFLNHILCIDQRFEINGRQPLPKVLRPLMSRILARKDYTLLRIVFTSLYISRYFRLEVSPSFSTIEQGPSFLGDPSEEREMMRLFLKELGINTRAIGRPSKKLSFKEFHMTSKSGPSGHALWTSFIDSHVLTPSQLFNIEKVGGVKLSELILKFRSLSSQIPQFFLGYLSRKGQGITRKLTALKDKEGKTREVAILDYYSQSALRPLHNFLYKQLSRIDQDCTHNQTKHFNTLLPDIGSSFHSIDLTAATDRFPIDLQKELLSVWFGEEYASHWRSLMVDYPFRYADKDIFYRTGNPMGAYSSFAVFAITHHYLVFKAAKAAKRNWKRVPYMLLGDDIVIANDHVKEEYLKLLELWGIPFNPEKTHSSPYGFEFAKQVRLNGVNVTPFPISALLDRKRQLLNAIGIIYEEVHKKDWKMIKENPYHLYSRMVHGLNRQRLSVMKPRIDTVISFLDFLNGRGSLGPAVKQYVVHLTGSTLKWSDFHFDQHADRIAKRVIIKSFLESRERITDSNNPKPLGLLAEQMVMSITSLRDGGADCFDLIESVPFLQIYGRAEETYLELMRDEEVKFGSLHDPKGFRKLFDKVNIPLSDEGFYVRNRDVMVVVSQKVSRLLLEGIKEDPWILQGPDKRKRAPFSLNSF